MTKQDPWKAYISQVQRDIPRLKDGPELEARCKLLWSRDASNKARARASWSDDQILHLITSMASAYALSPRLQADQVMGLWETVSQLMESVSRIRALGLE